MLQPINENQHAIQSRWPSKIVKKLYHFLTMPPDVSQLHSPLTDRLSWTATWLAVLLMVVIGAHCDPSQSCEPCICQNYTREYIDVTCVNVPLVSVPRFWDQQSGKFMKNKFQHLYRIRMIGVSEMTQLDPNSFQNLVSLASLTISKSKISYINETTFATTAIRNTLSTVDLSFGNLMEIPVDALKHLHQLQWLSLKGNQIETIRGKDLAQLKTLRTLLLSENLISILEDRTFEQLSSLESIEIDFNSLERVEGHSVFPASLKSLSICNSLLRKIPSESLQNLPRLQVLSLRGNLINHLSPFKLAGSGIRRIDLIDLSHNLISNLPNDLFASQSALRHSFALRSQSEGTHSLTVRNGSVAKSSRSSAVVAAASDALEIRNLHLDFNFIHSIPPDLFRTVLIEKLTLSSNRIAELSASAFQGSPLEKGLKVLDLNYNLIENLSALKSLFALRQLFLKNNRIKEIDSEAFESLSTTLEILDLSQNLLDHIPSAFRALKQIVKINLHQNLITQLRGDDFRLWCHKLKSFSVSKNNLVVIEEDTFRSCSQLTELRLGGNKLLQPGNLVIDAALSQLRLLDLSSLGSVARWIEDDGHQSRQPLSHVKWLQFDFNSLSRVPQSLVKLLPSLMYLDLQNNKVNQLGDELNQFHNLTTVILSQNQLRTVPSNAFKNLSRLENIAIYFNQVSTIESGAFRNLPKLQQVVLSRNQVSRIERDAFQNLSSEALTLMLDQNRMQCLSANSFRHIETQNVATTRLYLNVSHNQIKTFGNCDSADRSRRGNQSGQTLPIRVLDVSFNQISRLTDHFLTTFCSHASSLFATNNLLHLLPTNLLSLPNLQTLSLNFNQISEPEKSPAETQQPLASKLHTFNLRYNAIKELTSFEYFFQHLHHLKSLDLTGNQIADIPENFFSQTALVKLVIAHNRLNLENEQDKCFGIAHTLKSLDVSHNSLSSLSSRLLTCASLVELLASHNRIHSFSYVSPLVRSLPQLQRLDLFANPVERISTIGVEAHEQHNLAFLSNHSALSWLNLNQLNIAHLDELHVPFLHRLELSGNSLGGNNSISSISSKTLSRSRNIRHLNLASNQLHEVPKHIWKYLTRLRYLDLSYNPIEILDSSSFAGLKYLQNLYISGLKLQYIDSRIFLYQSQLSNLKISTYPSIRSFRLQDILAKSDALKTIEIDVKESILSHQIQWAFGGKLRELVITGHNLAHILPDAFQGLNNANDLTLRITNTSIKHLPEGLLRYLADIRYISIDLRSNQLETVSPGVFFGGTTASENVKTWQSRQLLGGIVLEDNPLRCDCNLLWISRWIKQLFTEMKSINIETAILVKSSLAHSRCQSMGSRQSTGDGHISITQLTEEHVDGYCERNAAGRVFNLTIALLANILLISVLCCYG